jgi:RNA polymerase sigma-70 factor (ECF subfamily)
MAQKGKSAAEKPAQIESPLIEELHSRHEIALIAYCRVLLKNPADAEEIAQEAFLRLLNARERIDPNGNPAALLFKTARNLCLNHRRNLTRKKATSIETPVRQTDPELKMHRGERDRRLRTAVMALPARQREIVVLSCFADLKFKEIAKVTGVKVGTVASQKSKAFLSLRKVLERDFEEWMKHVE